MPLQYSAFWQQPSPVLFTYRTSLSHLLFFDNPSTNFIMLFVLYESRSSLLPPTLIPSNSAYPTFRFYLSPSLSTSSLKLMFHHEKISVFMEISFTVLLSLKGGNPLLTLLVLRPSQIKAVFSLIGSGDGPCFSLPPTDQSSSFLLSSKYQLNFEPSEFVMYCLVSWYHPLTPPNYLKTLPLV